MFRLAAGWRIISDASVTGYIHIMFLNMQREVDNKDRLKGNQRSLRWSEISIGLHNSLIICSHYQEVLTMKGRLFLPALLVTLIAAMGLSGSCLVATAGASEVTLTYANFPPAPTFPCVQMERWAKEVRERTKGKVEVKTFPGGTLLGAKNMYDGVLKGVADIGCLATAYQPGRFVFFEVMDLPFLFKSGAESSLAMWDLYDKEKPKTLDEVKVLTAFTCATASIMSQKPVRNLADLEDLKLRAAGTGVDIMKALGAAPEGMPMSQVPEALQKGVVQGLVSSLEVLKDMKFAEYPASLSHMLTYGWCRLWLL